MPRNRQRLVLCAGLLLSATAAAAPDPACTSSCASPMPVAVAGRLSVTTTGAGPDIVLVPGLASSAHVWDHVAARLAKTHRVHVVQVAGFAGAPAQANATGPVIAPTVAALHDYIHDAHLAPVALVGHSLGGLIGLQVGIDHPGDVGRLLIVDSLPFLGAIFGAPDVATAAVRAAAMRDEMLHESQAQYAAGSARLVPAMVGGDGASARLVAQGSATSDKNVVAQAMYDDMTTDLRHAIAAIHVPVSVLYPWQASGYGKPATDAFYRAQYAALPGVRFQRIDDARHFIMLDQPAKFDGAVDAFLAH